MRFWRETLHIKLRPSLLEALTKKSVMSQTLPGSYQRFWVAHLEICSEVTKPNAAPTCVR